MDVVLKVTANGISATVVRQFVPTRIEREVLAQVFTRVCDGPCDERAGQRQVQIPECQIDAEDQRTEAPATGRRAA